MTIASIYALQEILSIISDKFSSRLHVKLELGKESHFTNRYSSLWPYLPIHHTPYYDIFLQDNKRQSQHCPQISYHAVHFLQRNNQRYQSIPRTPAGETISTFKPLLSLDCSYFLLPHEEPPFLICQDNIAEHETL